MDQAGILRPILPVLITSAKSLEWTHQPGNVCDFALRDIEAGEELTNNYGEFHDGRVAWVQGVMAAFCPDRHRFFATIPVSQLRTEDDAEPLPASLAFAEAHSDLRAAHLPPAAAAVVLATV